MFAIHKSMNHVCYTHEVKISAMKNSSVHVSVYINIIINCDLDIFHNKASLIPQLTSKHVIANRCLNIMHLILNLNKLSYF